VIDTDSIMIFETLKKFSDNQGKDERLPAMDWYLDESDGKIKSRPISQSDMAASARIHKTMKQYIVKNPAKLIHDFMFAR